MSAAVFHRTLRTRPLAWRVGAVVAGALVMALASQAEIPLPGGVPLSLQTYALFVMAGLLGGALSLAAVILWLAAAGLGLPVLAGGAGGLQALFGPTMGFLIGMAAAASVTGRLAQRIGGFGPLLATFLGGHVIVLLVGWAGLLGMLAPGPAFTEGVLPFLPGALAKSLAAAATVRLVSR